jgi:hypothetical protein
LLEGKGKPDFLDLDRDGDRTEPMKKAAKEVDESMDESALQAYLGKKKYGEQGMKALQKAGREGAGKEKMVKIRAQHNKMDEADVEEGNDFTGARLAAIRAGKPTFKVDGKVYKVTGDTRDEKEQVDEREISSKDEFDRWANPGDTYKGAKGTITKTEKGVRHERHPEDYDDGEDSKQDDDDKPRKRGRPAGTKRSIGAKGPTGKSKLLNKGSIREGELEEDYDKDEYDEEGEMAMSQARTIEDAAQELQSILDADENLPEWVQKKIAMAKDYIDTARDYLKANRPEEENMMAEKAVSKAQRAAAGIAYAAKKGDIPKSELRGASKEMAQMATGELKKFAKTKEKGLPEKKKEESVEETTTSGSVATAPAEAPKGKKGMVFGKGVYESQIAESFDNKLKSVLTEGMNISINATDEGQNSVTVTATDEDAAKLSELLKMAGLFSSGGYSAVDTDDSNTCEACGGHEGMHEAGCSGRDMVEEELANSPDETYADMDTILNKIAGGLNGPKRQINPNNMGDNPMAMSKLGKGPASLNLGETMQQVQEETEQRLADLYKNYKG